MRSTLLVMLLCISSTHAVGARACTAEIVSLPELTQASDLVFVGRVTKVLKFEGSSLRSSSGVAEITILRTLKGAPPAKLEFRFAGGIEGDDCWTGPVPIPNNYLVVFAKSGSRIIVTDFHPAELIFRKPRPGAQENPSIAADDLRRALAPARWPR